MADKHTHDERHDRPDDSRDADRFRPDEVPRIAPLADLGDFKVADGYPDPRGWDVLDAAGRKVGTVHDLIVDTGQLRTRYLDVALDKNAIGSRDDRDVLVPVGTARLDDDSDQVMLTSFSTAQLSTLPEFNHTEITRDYENSILSHMPDRADALPGAAGAAGAAAMEHAHDDYYAGHRFDDRHFFGRRGDATHDATGDERRAANTAATESTTNAANATNAATPARPVTVRHEEVTIERRPIQGDRSADTRNLEGDSEIRIPVTEEQVIVERRVVPKEEIVIHKRMVDDAQSASREDRRDEGTHDEGRRDR
jgi:uncharacterized protein (TIGR02271 family)